MRSDMGKVLVERPRVGRWRGDSRPGKGYNKSLKRCLDAGDSPPAREGMKRSHSRNSKHFNEHLAPLRRFLETNVGRPWDKVYSEICQHVDRGNVVQKHILTHLFDYVVTNTVLIDGEPCRGASYGYRYGESLRTTYRYHQWYVCPKSGLLRASRHEPRERQRDEPLRTLKLNNKQLCVFRDGQWELLSVVMTVQGVAGESPAYDAVLQQHLKDGRRAAETVRWFHNNRYTVSRRALSRRDLLGLPIPIEWLR